MAKKNYNIKIKETTKQKEETERFDYQEDAINNLKLLDDKFPNYYSTLIVVPTGGGKTRIAVEYLYRNVLNKKGHKVLWIAERLLLLEQAYDTFADLADREHLQGKEESHLITRLISSKHGNYGDTSFHDGIDLVIMTQQTLEKNIDRDSKIVKAMEKWLIEDDCLTIIIDEAHHAIAKPYRAILLSLLKLRKERKFKECHVIGLTATPKREENDEIEEIFSFGVMNNKENECIATSETSYGYQISIHDLVSKEILAIPYMAQIGGYEDKDEAIVSVYKEGASKLHFYDGQTGEDETAEIKEKFDSFGQSILFADSRIHALKLKKMFESMKIKCGLAISIDKKFENIFYQKAGEGTLEEYLGKNVSEIKQQIKKDRQDYKDGNLPLIITVELLKEGVDIPKTQTVFIAKDKIDDVDVTQMVGRALRGRFQKGTPTAFIVSFGIGKLEKMLWETPESYHKNREVF